MVVWYRAFLVTLVAGWFVGATELQAMPLWQTADFAKYWFQGKAEVNHYKLEQNRYGEMREGHAVLVFVTEDFLPKKQVKADNPDRTQTGAVPVMKLNHLRKFVTGIYDYANMTSVFTPLDAVKYPQTLKTTTSIQEWCGQTWLQANWRGKEYQVQGHSYFESEGDVLFPLPKATFEDELLSRIRLGQIKEGPVQLLIGGQDAGMLHQAWQAQPARLTIKSGKHHSTLLVQYDHLPRRLEIAYETAFPHGIVTVTTHSGKTLLSRLTRTNHMQSAYWVRNHNADVPLRKMLDLPTD